MECLQVQRLPELCECFRVSLGSLLRACFKTNSGLGVKAGDKKYLAARLSLKTQGFTNI